MRKALSWTTVQGLDLDNSHLSRMSFAVKEDVSLDPVDVCLFGAYRVVLEAYDITYLIQ